MNVSETTSDSALERQINGGLGDASLENVDQREAVNDQISNTVQNTELVAMQEKEEEVTKSSEQSIVNLRIRDYFCDLCKQSFTRAQSLNRHNERKHAILKDPVRKEDPRPKRARTKSKTIEQEECAPTETCGTLKCPDGLKMRYLKIKLSKHRTPVVSTDKDEKNSMETIDHKTEGDYPMGEEELTAIQALKDACEKLQTLGKQVVVITSNGEHAEWFGSNYGVKFAQDNPEVIGRFFTYCKEKEEEWRQEMKITIKAESESVEDRKMDVKENTSESFVGNGDDNASEDDDDGDDDDDYDNEENEEDSDYDDNDSKDCKTVFKPLLGKSKRICLNRKVIFQEIAENLSANENSRDASIIKNKKNGVRTLVYTVEELNRGKYQCTLCGYKFLWKCHLEVHQAKNPYCVHKKDVKITENDVLKENITFENSQTGVLITSTFQELLDSQTVDPISCAVCGRGGFHNRGKLRDHLVLHNESNIFECNICNSGFTAVGILSAHLKEHFKKPFECLSCQWRFTTDFELQQHTIGGCRSVSLIDDPKNTDLGLDDIVYKCSVCSSEIVGIKILRKHLEVEHFKQFGPFECILCDKQFSGTRLFNRHMLIHRNKYSCPYCPKTFSEKSSSFFTHVKSHRRKTELPYVCDICGAQFKNKRYFDPHRRIHTGERPYVCKVEGCVKSFRSADGLDQHKWCHINQHFICDFCGRKFKKPSLLNNHRLTHTQEWRYPCIYCELKFKRLRPFKRHLARVHPTKVEDVKEKFKIILHPCDECPKVFFDKEDHTTHINRHKGIKPFSCKICSKKFSDKSNMTNHIKGHLGGKKLKCKLCPRRFNTEKFLQEHVVRIHTSKSDIHVGENGGNRDDQDEDESQRLTIALSDNEEDIDQLRESTLQIIDETIRGNVSFE